MKLYFVRHGQTEANVTMSGNPSDDVPLNKLGIQQATNLAAELKDVKFDVLVSSPLKRAQQTADIINQNHQLAIQSDTAWREREQESHLTLDLWNDAFSFNTDTQVDGIEPLTDFFARVYAALDGLKQDYSNKTVLVVSHGGLRSCLYAYANSLPLSGDMQIAPMKNCEYRIYDL